jgi:YHS domain-containing protein
MFIKYDTAKGRPPARTDEDHHYFYLLSRINPENKECSTMATDPVCYSAIDEDEARYSSRYKGQDYFFCSGFCKRKFDENPGRYAKMARNIDTGSDITC